MVAGAASSLASSGALATAQAEASRLKGQKGPESNNARTSAANINSIFEAAKKAVEEAKANGTSISDNAVNDINNKSSEIVQASEANAKEIEQIIADSAKVIADYTAQIASLSEEKKGIEAKILEKGGQVQETPQENTPAPSGDSSQIVVIDGEGNQVEVQPAQNGGENPAPVQGGEGEAVDPEIAQLQSQLEGINGQIGEVNTQLATAAAEQTTQTTAKVLENTTMVDAGQAEITSIKTTADSQLNAEITNINQASTKATQDFTKEQTDQTTHQTTNTTNSTEAKTAAQAARSAAQAAASDDPNKAQLEQVAQELDGLSTDFGIQNGIAKSNNDNITSISNYQQQINSAVSSAISGDFQQFSRKLNEAFNQAMQDTSNAKN
ncbi:MAG: hypothetical protein NC200_07395, partial [Candidatus Gastranaerophilales bacterium]|nr:hypothetical protein [Candidatus Gastranaerophilales bacterium]